MTSRACLRLLHLLEKQNINFHDICMNMDDLFDLNQELVLEILDMSTPYQIKKAIELLNIIKYTEGLNDSIEYQKECLNILKKCTDKYKILYISKVLCNKNAIDLKFSLIAAEELMNLDEKYKLQYSVSILCQKIVAEPYVILEGIRIIGKSQYEYQAKYIRDVLTNSIPTHAKIALEGARIILESAEEYQAKHISEILCDKDVVMERMALKCARMILDTRKEYQAKYMSKLTMDKNSIDSKLVYPGLEMILKANEEYKAKYIQMALRLPTVIKEGISLKVAKIIYNVDCEYKAYYIIGLLSYNEIVDSKMALVYIDYINTSTNELQARQMFEGICNGECSHTYKKDLLKKNNHNKDMTLKDAITLLESLDEIEEIDKEVIKKLIINNKQK